MITSVTDPLLTSGFSDGTFVAYPNLVPTTLLIRYLQPEATEITLDVYSAGGRIEKKALSLNRLSDGLFSLDLPVHDLPPGLYVLRLTDGPASAVCGLYDAEPVSWKMA